MWKNGYIESFNSKLADEGLNREIFYLLEETKILIEMWRKEYNQIRPHNSLGHSPPAPEVIQTSLLANPVIDTSSGSLT